ncbi:hypothetical protein FQN53_008759 [Emmonsiellopsis sp. PD_33]|nr:hypothetical protein FQN53_008759 [Emmonsiellopsis sp. PD_33]
MDPSLDDPYWASQENVFLPPPSSKLQQNLFSKSNIPTTCCCSLHAFCNPHLSSPDRFSPTKAINTLISSFSNEPKTKSCLLALSGLPTALSGFPRGVKRRPTAVKSHAGPPSSPSSEWLKLMNPGQSMEYLVKDSILPRPLDTFAAENQSQLPNPPDETPAASADPSMGGKFPYSSGEIADYKFFSRPGTLSRRLASPFTRRRTRHNDSGPGLEPDITVHAFGNYYFLHRDFLERSPYFYAMFSGNWLESNSNKIELFPKDMDENTSAAGFDVALKYIYAQMVMDQIDADPIGVFAVSSWLDLPQLQGWASQHILRRLTYSNVSVALTIFSKNCYGMEGDIVLHGARSLLCLQGYNAPLSVWDDIPGELTREMVGGDTFFVDTEFRRWKYAVSILDRILTKKATEVHIHFRDFTFSCPDPVMLELEGALPKGVSCTDGVSVGFEAIYRQWLDLYSDPDILPIRDMIVQDIAYMHIPFEHFRDIMSHRDVFGVRVVPPAVLRLAIFQALKLGHLALSTNDSSPELNVETARYQPSLSQWSQVRKFFADETVDPSSSPCDEAVSHQYDVPIDDSHTSNVTVSRKGRGNILDCATSSFYGRLNSTTLVLGWQSNGFVSRPRPARTAEYPKTISFPPFRISLSFPNPTTLHERKRVYSAPFWYAGTTWNLCLRRSASGNEQRAGLYLRRIYDPRPSELSLDQWATQLQPRYTGCVGPCNPEPTDAPQTMNVEYGYYDPQQTTARELAENFSGTNIRMQYFQAPAASFPSPPGEVPYIDSRSAVTMWFKLYSNFKCADRPTCFESRPEQFSIDQCWGWNVSIPTGQELLSDLHGNKLMQKELKVNIVMGAL